MVAALKEKDVSDTKIRISPSNTQSTMSVRYKQLVELRHLQWKTLASYLELEIDSILALIPPEELSTSSSGQPCTSKDDEINNSPVSCIAGECQRTRLFLVSHSLSFGGLLGIQGQIYISQPALRQNQIYLKNLARYKECQEKCPRQVS